MQRRNNNNNNNANRHFSRRNRLANAFALRSRDPSMQDQSAFVPKDAAPVPQQQQEQVPQQQQQQQQQAPFAEPQMPNNQEQEQQAQEEFVSVSKKHEAIEFLEKHNIPTFVPVYEDVTAIQVNPSQPNQALKGQVPWKCAHCGANSFGHHCMGCVRHRDQAALRVFIGQLCKEGSGEIVKKMIEVLVDPFLTSPVIFVEPHTDAVSGRGKGCAWVYVASVQDIQTVVKCLNKRTFVTVDEITGNVGFVAFPSSFSNSEIEHCFQEDHHAQSKDLQSLFMFTCISAQVPKALQAFAPNPNAAANKNGASQKKANKHNTNAAAPASSSVAPPPPSYGSSLPPPPCYQPGASAVQQQQQVPVPVSAIVPPPAPTMVMMDNRQFEELQKRQQQQQQQYHHQQYQQAPPPPVQQQVAYLGQYPQPQPQQFNNYGYQQQQHHMPPPPPMQYHQHQHQQQQPVYTASWAANVGGSSGQDDDNFF